MPGSIGPLLAAADRLVGMTPTLRFDSPGKRLQGGEFLFHMEDGSERPWPEFGLSGDEPTL